MRVSEDAPFERFSWFCCRENLNFLFLQRCRRYSFFRSRAVIDVPYDCIDMTAKAAARIDYAFTPIKNSMKLEKMRRGNNSAGGESGLNGNNWSSVCYGDHVRLSMNTASNALLGAEGVINSEIRVLVDSNRMDRCVWQICSAYQYSAAKELNEYVKEIEDSRATNLTATDADIESDRNDSHLYALKREKHMKIRRT